MLLYGGYVLFALSAPLALMILTIFVLRLAQHKLPGAEVGVSMFLPLGPLGTGGLALLQLNWARRPPACWPHRAWVNSARS